MTTQRKMRATQRVSRTSLTMLVLVAVSIGATLLAQAAITTPTNNATVRGEVFINENRGGVEDTVCGSLGLRANSTITVTRVSNGAQVFSKSQGSAGPWSTVWDSRAELANGTFRIKSVAKDRRATFAGAYCFGTITTTLSDITVYLENFTAFVDDRGAGTILVNPYLKMFRFTAPGYDSGNKSDPNMQIQGVPAAPGAPVAPTPPVVKAVCTDPTSATFLPFIVEQGPQGCLDPNPVPVIKVPPDPPNPPPAPSSQCDVPGTSGCNDTVITISYRDADLTLDGTFDAGTRRFAATVVLADPRAFALSHVGAP